VGEWHVDMRSSSFHPHDFVARGTVKGLSGNQWRMCSELARTTGLISRPMVPTPSDLLHVTDEKPVAYGSIIDGKINKEDKATQRGPHVAGNLP